MVCWAVTRAPKKPSQVQRGRIGSFLNRGDGSQATYCILHDLGYADLCRVTCLWFMISCVISIEAKIPCPECGDLDDMPLLSNKTLWEARSYEEWQVEKAFYDVSSPVLTLGELLRIKRNPGHPLNEQRLRTWDAGADKMGVMLNIAIEFVSK
jgi:hypothetical protein